MIRVLHIPSHLSYVGKLAGSTFAPVAAPLERPPRVVEVLALESWGFFDLLHLHTVELASVSSLTALIERLRRERKGLVFTAHDLVPNIEVEVRTFAEKTQVVGRQASRVITLTQAAADELASQFDVSAAVLPHGFAVAPAEARRCVRSAGALLAFGALRPNRDFVGLACAWRRLGPGRPPLRLVLRSVRTRDRLRYAGELDVLARMAAVTPGLTVDMVNRVLTSAELLARCQDTAALVMPYRSITHSGQLELARDLGIPAIVPDVDTVRAQLSESPTQDHPCVWFPPTELADPSAFARHLEQVAELATPGASSDSAFGLHRAAEHQRLLDAHSTAYECSLC